MIVSRAFFAVPLLLLAVPGAEARRDFAVVSDYDDTLKVSNVAGSRWDFVRRTFLDERFYAGMERLYNVWHDGSTRSEPPLHIVSASPRQLREKIEEDLEEEGGFPPFRLSLRDWLRQRNTVDYKLGELRRHAGARPGPILVGDDTEHDPKVYETFARDHAVTAVYIRHVTGKPLARGQRSFLTAFDIAAAEHRDGRLTLPEARAVGEAVLRAEDESLVPKFISCAGLANRCVALALDRELATLCSRIEERVARICARRD